MRLGAVAGARMTMFRETGKIPYDSRLAIAAFVVVYFVIVVRTAWLSDDAAITLRTVLNFINGYGPTFNIDERVQAYTHPLWFGLLSLGAIAVGNVFHATFILSIVVSVAAFALLLTAFARDAYMLFFLGVAVILSRAFVDFSTSGLENPLSHLLLLVAVLCASSAIEDEGKRLTAFFLACAALYLNRQDLLLIVFPLALYVALATIHKPTQLFMAIGIAAAPVVLWTAFSLFYYGFPFPNTAYAKIGTGIALGERVLQGFRYIFYSFDKDPATILVILLGTTVGLFGSTLNKCLAVGVLLYIAYLVSIGGDFMAGRFLTAPLLVSLVILAREITSRNAIILLTILVFVAGVGNIRPNIISGSSYTNDNAISSSGVADERGFYYQTYGLLQADRGTFVAPPWKVSDRRVEIGCGQLGFNSVRAGPGVHIIDDCALTDPLLARLPAKRNIHWRIGHFIRQLPTNYEMSLVRGENLLSDEKTRAYWEAIRAVTRGPLFDGRRFGEMIRLNFGLVEQPDQRMYRREFVPRSTTIISVPEDELDAIRADGTARDAAGNAVFDNAMEMAFRLPRNIGAIDISVDGNDFYEISAFSGQEWREIAVIVPVDKDGLIRHRIQLESVARDVEKIRIDGRFGDYKYSVGHIIFSEP